MENIFLFFLGGAFFIGSIPTAYWTAKRSGVDIRQHGSGNVGATNAFRVLGKKVGAFVFVCDFLKGALPVFVFNQIQPAAAPIQSLGIGIAAILGHIFTPFLGGKGGKGVATGAGALLVSFPWLFFQSMGIWALTFFIWRIVSVSSLLALFSITFFCYFQTRDLSSTTAFAALSLLITWTHRSNLKRLFLGTEKPISKTSKK